MKTATESSPPNSLEQLGFTRTELVVILGGLALLGTLILPALASTRWRAERVICANNLRQIGMAVHVAADDKDDFIRWEIRISAPGGGPYPTDLAINAWFHFAAISNELKTPKVLWCPSDIGTPATHFGGGTNGGYLHPNFANRATSYFVSHGSSSHFEPTDIISGDRNLGFDSFVGCALFYNAWTASVNPIPSSNFRWDTNLHSEAGNVLRRDGRVDQFSNKKLRDDIIQIRRAGDDLSSFHFIKPR